jgi:26S proteasome regulatory subunit N2
MDVDQTPTTPKTSAPEVDKMDVDEDKEAKTQEKKNSGDAEKESTSPAETAKKKLEKERVGYDIENLSRVLPAQLKFLSFPAGRYKPVKKVGGRVNFSADHFTNSDTADRRGNLTD